MSPNVNDSIGGPPENVYTSYDHPMITDSPRFGDEVEEPNISPERQP